MCSCKAEQRVRPLAGEHPRRGKLSVKHLFYQVEQNALLVAELEKRRTADDARHVGDLLGGRPLISFLQKQLHRHGQYFSARDHAARLNSLFHSPEKLLNSDVVYKYDYTGKAGFLQENPAFSDI